MALVSDVVNAQRNMELCWTQKLADFERRLNASVTPSNPTLLQLRDEFKVFKDLVVNMLNLLGQQLRDNARAIDLIDMRSRQKVILFNGIPEENDAEQQVLNLLHNQLGLAEVSSSSIKRCHRIGAKGKEYIRSVLVHFRDHRVKSSVWSLKAKFKGTPVSVSEFLTKPRQLIHKKARTHFGFKNVWTLDGIINIKVPGGGRVKVVTNEEVDTLIAKYPLNTPPVGPLAKSGSGESTDDGLHGDQPRAPNSNRIQEARRKQLGDTPTEDTKRSRRAIPKK